MVLICTIYYNHLNIDYKWMKQRQIIFVCIMMRKQWYSVQNRVKQCIMMHTDSGAWSVLGQPTQKELMNWGQYSYNHFLKIFFIFYNFHILHFFNSHAPCVLRYYIKFFVLVVFMCQIYLSKMPSELRWKKTSMWKDKKKESERKKN